MLSPSFMCRAPTACSSVASQHPPACASAFTAAEAFCRNVRTFCASSLVPSRPPGAPGWPGISVSQSMASTLLSESSHSIG